MERRIQKKKNKDSIKRNQKIWQPPSFKNNIQLVNNTELLMKNVRK